MAMEDSRSRNDTKETKETQKDTSEDGDKKQPDVPFSTGTDQHQMPTVKR
jgi:hypothetical protein